MRAGNESTNLLSRSPSDISRSVFSSSRERVENPLHDAIHLVSELRDAESRIDDVDDDILRSGQSGDFSSEEEVEDCVDESVRGGVGRDGRRTLRDVVSIRGSVLSFVV